LPEVVERAGVPAWYEGYGIDFDFHVVKQIACPDGRPGRIGLQKEAGINIIHRWKIGKVPEVDRAPDHIRKRCSGGPKDGFDVPQGQFAFAANIAENETAARGVNGALTRDEDKVAGEDSLGVRSLGGRGLLGEDDSLFRHCWNPL
jgi:hypothetical protein